MLHLRGAIGEFRRLAARQLVVDRAVHQQVRVAADRRGEMGIGFQREAEVALVAGLIDRQALRAQQDLHDEPLVGPAAGLLHDALEIARLRMIAPGHANALPLQELRQALDLQRGRRRVHPERRRQAVAQQEAGRLHVGQDHALLDDAVRVVALHRQQGIDVALRVETEPDLGGFKIDRPPLQARATQGPVQRMQVVEVAGDGALASVALELPLLQVAPYLPVGEACAGTHDAGHEPGTRHPPLIIDRHVAGQAQTVLVGLQRAEPVGQDFRQHRDHAIRKIDRGRPQQGFLVKPAAGLHVTGDVRDGHHQPPTAPIATGVHRIVEIPGIRAVDGHQRQVPQILAARVQALRHPGAEPLRLGLDAARPRVGQPEVADGDLGGHAGGRGLAQHLGDPADRCLAGARLADNGRDHHVARPRLACLAGRYEHVLGNATIVRHHEPHAAFFHVASHDGLVRPLQNLAHRALPPPARIDPDHAGEHPVPMQYAAHLPG